MSLSFTADIRELTRQHVEKLDAKRQEIENFKKTKREYYSPEIFAKKCAEMEAVCSELVQTGKDKINECCDAYIQAAREADLLDGSKITPDAVLLNRQFRVKAADLTAAFDRAEGNRTMQRLIAEYAAETGLPLDRVFYTAEAKAAGAEVLRQYAVGALSDPWRFAFLSDDKHFAKICPAAVKMD